MAVSLALLGPGLPLEAADKPALNGFVLPAAPLSVEEEQAPRLPASSGDPVPDSGEETEPFNLTVSPAQAASYSARWRSVVDAVTRESETLARCRVEPDPCPLAARWFLNIVDAALATEGRARVGELNRAVNLAIRYASDIAHHAAPDVWTSPLETLSSGRGDCEDYAIVKYAALREAGMPSSDLRIVVVRDRTMQHHAVLAARHEKRWLVLDNRRLLLLEDQEIRDYVAVAAFGAEPGPVHAALGEDDGYKVAQPLAPVPLPADPS